ncbi:MAG: WG repeat-containing protein [Cyclobacteriaceae bacterium]|nr:WG repeat-containing protein [Cyclobacteriaceae bacterium]
MNLKVLIAFIFSLQSLAIFGQELKYRDVNNTRHKAEFTSYVSKDRILFKIGDTLKVLSTPNMLNGFGVLVSKKKIEGHELVVISIGIYPANFAHVDSEQCPHEPELTCKDPATDKTYKVQIEKSIANREIELKGGGSLAGNRGDAITSESIKLSFGSIAPNAKILNYKASQSSNFILNEIHDGFAVVKDGQLKGLINEKGEIVVPYGKYSDFGIAANGYIPVKSIQSNKWGILNYKGEVIMDFVVEDEIHLIDKNGIFGSKIYLGNKYYFEEYRNVNGEKLIVKSDKSAQTLLFSGIMSGDFYSVINSSGKMGFIDKIGTLVIEPVYEDASHFSEGLAAVAKKNEVGDTKWGFINTNGQIVIDFIYSNRPGSFKNGLAHVVSKSGEHAWISRTGEVKFKAADFSEWQLGPHYDFDMPIILAIKKDKTKRTWIDSNGKFKTFSADDENVQGLSRRGFYFVSFENGQILIKVSDYLDKEGDMLQQLFLDKDGGYYGIIDKNGDVVLPPIFSKLQSFDPRSGLARATIINDKDEIIEGYINHEGIFVIIKGKPTSEW